jgi:hypothetical protein
MNHNKLDHLIIGFIIMIGGLLIAFLAPRFLPEFLKLPCLVIGTAIACLGWFQAVVVGHAPYYILALVFAPFMIVREIFGMPVKKKDGVVTWGGEKVIAYWMKAERVVLVREFTEYIQCISGRSIFARPRKLEKIGHVLESGRVPETPLDKERLRKAVDRWGGDERLMKRARKSARTRDRVPAAGPPVRLQSPSKDEVDFVHEFVDLLWRLRRETDRDDIIQLAVWYALEVDRVYDARPAA